MKQNFILKFKRGRIKRCNDTYENIMSKYGDKILWIDVINGVKI